VGDIALWGLTLGFFSFAGALLMTLVALRAGGRRRFLMVFAATTLVIGVYQFWMSNWAARTASATDRCISTGHYGHGRIERIPPGVRGSRGGREFASRAR
jgi:hypothetical protein